MPAHLGDTSNTCRHVTTTYSHTTLNQASSEFLDLQSSDHKILEKFSNILMQDGEIFAKVFYDYLMASPTTAKVLNEYQAQGRLIDDLVEKQLQHLFGILSGPIDDASAERMAHIDELHHRFEIKPVWIMEAYRLYLEHLQILIRNGHEIQNQDRTILEDRVIVRSMIDLAHNLGLNVVAEGIEDNETLELPTMMGCDGAQGFCFSQPQTAEGFLNWINSQSSPKHSLKTFVA